MKKKFTIADQNVLYFYLCMYLSVIKKLFVCKYMHTNLSLSHVNICTHTSLSLAHTHTRTQAHSTPPLYTSAYVSIRQHTPAYASIRQHTSAYVSIPPHLSTYSCAYTSTLRFVFCMNDIQMKKKENKMCTYQYLQHARGRDRAKGFALHGHHKHARCCQRHRCTGI
jgi:hypothetical protein